MRGIANKLLSDGIFQAFGKFIQQSTMVMSMTFLKSKYRKQEFELAAYDTLFLKYKKERKPNVTMPFRMPFRRRLLLFLGKLLLLITTIKEDKKYVNEDIELNILCHPHCSCCNNLVMPLRAKYTGFLTLARLLRMLLLWIASYHCCC